MTFCGRVRALSFLLVLVFLISMSASVFAADTGWESPSNNSNSGWNNPNNAYVSDDSRASADSSSDFVQYRNFSFSIPAGATIDGIE